MIWRGLLVDRPAALVDRLSVVGLFLLALLAVFTSATVVWFLN